MSTPRPRRIASFAAGGSYAQGLPAAAPATGYTPGPETNAAGSWGAAAETGGIPGDANMSPVGAGPTPAGPQPGNYVPPPAALPAAAPNIAAAAPPTPAPGSNMIEFSGLSGNMGGYGLAKGGPVKEGIPTEHFAGGGRSGHGGFTTPALPPGYITDIGAPASTNDQQDPYQRRASAPGFGIDSQHHLSPGDYSKGEPTPDQGSSLWDAPLQQSQKNEQPKPPPQPKQQQQQQKPPQQQQQQQPPSSPTPGAWNGGLDNLPAPPAPGNTGNGSGGATPPANAGIPTDAMGSPGAAADTAGAGGADTAAGAGGADTAAGAGGADTAGAGGAGTNAMGSPGAAAPAADAAAGAASGGLAEGGPIVNPKEEPYREKWRAKNGQKQTPYKAFDDGGTVPTDNSQGAIPNSADIPVQQDQGQQGQAGDPMQVLQGVKDALSYTRQQAGLSDNAFKMATDQKLAGNMPGKPAGPGGDQPNPNPFPIKTPATPFGTKTSQNDNSAQAAEDGGPIHSSNSGRILNELPHKPFSETHGPLPITPPSSTPGNTQPKQSAIPTEDNEAA